MGRYSDSPDQYNRKLTPVMYEGIEIDIDPETGGVWLDAGELNHIIDAREKLFSSAELAAMAERPKVFGVPQDELDTERTSPITGKPMRPVNYGGDSGIIIDRCEDTGGLWLDAGELEKIQQVVEAWEDLQPEKKKEIEALLKRTEVELDAGDDVEIASLKMFDNVPGLNVLAGLARRFINTAINGVIDLSDR